ncbi:putative sensor histidine kinase/response regulator [Aspergillus clavatus NRRL 1]|uniref:histidine kinase n=1 Tax=Aspergillus clavatus (strain ATCC 1007 / CBS 513.65 / DSM 816 / NCTC 3887 / NRRL 1 / QM 1276 / 107) TaxID=344612 RepID=A1CTI2_ASPCL|nr:sensor histidine kinase/response regulator, putative [Aspergillus clavatus NRRL 1]EAW06619.1 sensor histidine kinase/response regulator, putative [Aspergillus clavatus NRRL 1]
MSEGDLGSASASDKRGDEDQQKNLTSGAVTYRAPWGRQISLPEPLRIATNTAEDSSTTSPATITTLKLPRLSPGTAERVFPISSVVSLDSTPSSAFQTPPFETYENRDSPSTERQPNILNEQSSAQPVVHASEDTKSASAVQAAQGSPEDSKKAAKSKNERSMPGPSATEKNTHVSLKYETKESQSASKKPQQSFPEPAELGKDQVGNVSSRYEAASSQRPQELHSFGALVVLKESDQGLIVQIASRNTEEVLGYTPTELFGLKSFCDIIRPDYEESFLSRVSLVRNDWYNVEQHGPDIFEFRLHIPCGTMKRLWCTIHASGTNTRHIVCEFEIMEDSHYWQGLARRKSKPGDAHKGSKGKKLEEKDITPGLPLELQQILKRIRGDFHSVDMLSALSLVTRLAASASSLSSLFNYIIGIIRELTAFSRVTIYRFDHNWNAVPVADAVDQCVISSGPGDLLFTKPISPGDLAKLHLANKVSLEFSHREPGSELVYRDSEGSSVDVDLGHCYLISKSPDLVDHVTGMPVCARMSINISFFGRAWGLISCQSYEKGMGLAPPIQKLCWLISDILSANIERLSNTLPFQMQELLSCPIEVKSEGDSTQAKDILSLFNANYAASLILGETKILGKPLDSQEVLAFVEYIKLSQHNTILCSTDVGKDFPDLRYAPGFKYISSLLHVPLSVDGQDFITFFRTSHSRANIRAGDDCNARYLDQEPGKKDKFDKRAINCTSDGWNAIDLQKGSVLSLIYRAFTEVWQQKEAAMQSTQLMRLLLANCAHEFRTPLNAIINYLEIALDGSLSQETRESLSRSHSASKSLIFIINDLLDLTNAENGRSLIKDEIFDLLQTIHEASDIFVEEAKQKSVELHVVQHSNLPRVLGDQRRVRQVITNLISNAVQHTSSSDTVTVESCILPDYSEVGKLGVEVAIHDTGSGMSEEAIEALFCELEQVSNADYLQRSQHCSSVMAGPGSESKNVLGLGLALVARIVRNMNGQLSAKSERGRGSCFRIRMQFPLPTDSVGDQIPVEINQRGDEKKAETKKLGKNQKSEKARGSNRGNCGTSSLAKDPVIPQTGSISKRNESGGEGQHISESKSDTIPPSVKTQQEGQAAHGSHGLSAKSRRRKRTRKGRKGASEGHPEKVIESKTPEQQEDRASPGGLGKEQSQAHASGSSSKHTLHILVAEDDPTNGAIVRKRLEKAGHTVLMTGNGKECASAFRDNAGGYDVVLMDLQMPIVDGMGSTKMIRECEHSAMASSSNAPTCSSQRIPIFAVSASLKETERQTYIDSGFDGWIMKPIDFRRVNDLLAGVHQEEARNDNIYKVGMWEKGGWFDKRSA